VKRETVYIPLNLSLDKLGTGSSKGDFLILLEFTILIIHKQNLFGYKLVAKLLGGRNSCLERKLPEEIATKPNTKRRGTQLTDLRYWYTHTQ